MVVHSSHISQTDSILHKTSTKIATTSGMKIDVERTNMTTGRVLYTKFLAMAATCLTVENLGVARQLELMGIARHLTKIHLLTRYTHQ